MCEWRRRQRHRAGISDQRRTKSKPENWLYEYYFINFIFHVCLQHRMNQPILARIRANSCMWHTTQRVNKNQKGKMNGEKNIFYHKYIKHIAHTPHIGSLSARHEAKLNGKQFVMRIYFEKRFHSVFESHPDIAHFGISSRCNCNYFEIERQF